WGPVFFAPRLNDALKRNQLDVTSADQASKNGERAADFTADLRGSAFHDEIGHLTELFFLSERFVDALPRRLENHLLMNTFTGMRDPIPIGLWSRRAERAFGDSEYRQDCGQPCRKISSCIPGDVHCPCVLSGGLLSAAYRGVIHRQRKGTR